MYCNKCGNKINNDMRFCSKCGNYLGDVNNNYKTYNPNQKKNKNIGLIIGVIAILIAIILFFILTSIIVIVLLFGSVNKSNYNDDSYNSGENYNNNYNNEKNKSTTNVTTTKKRQSDQTAIESENTYKGLNIKSLKEAKDIIKKDSEEQKKDTTSAEVQKIENNIINKYKVTAVNLGEIDLEFAKELENVLDVLYKDYPECKEYLTNLTITNYSPMNGTIAYFQPIFPFTTEKTFSTLPWTIKTRISLVSSYFLNESLLENTAKIGSSAGHFPKNSTKYSPLAHEFGHFVSFTALLKEYNVDSITYIKKTDNPQKLVEIANNFNNRRFFTKNVKRSL